LPRNLRRARWFCQLPRQFGRTVRTLAFPPGSNTLALAHATAIKIAATFAAKNRGKGRRKCHAADTRMHL
jgi:hypothetical protein